jgi:putative transposase
MFTVSKYAKVFVSNDLTRQKYDELHDLAVSIREHKNLISREICSDILHYLDVSPLNFVTEMRGKYKGVINSNFDKQLYQQVIDAYQNKFDAITKRMKFETISFLGFEFYKRNCKGHTKGDMKCVRLERKSTDLSICLTYLARYGNEGTLEYINTQLANGELDEKKVKFYQNILDKCNKFTFERLMKLALSLRRRILKRYAKPIEFKSLTFAGRSRKKRIVAYNKNYNSEINAFISLSFPTRKSMDIPVKFSKDYHGAMGDYMKTSNDYEYVVSFDEWHKQVKVNLVKDDERYIPTVFDADKVVGIDVNVKHNLFSLSDGTTYDYDRQLVEDYCRMKRQTDLFKSQNKDYVVGKRRQRKYDTLRNKMLKSEQQLISTMCKTLMLGGVTHIVLENLDNGFGKSYIKNESLDGINFNDIVKFLGISSLKGEIEHIGRKYNIAVSTVQSYYTSKTCPVCGCIDDGNRLTQEDFCCVECGHTDNADHNASVNIRNRVAVTVLRERLLKQLGNGAYEPKKLKKDKVKDVLLSYRTDNQTIGGNV